MNILGINIGHDSGATLISKGKITAAVNEERLSRQKMHHGFPFLAIEEVLSIAGFGFSDLDCVAVEGKHILPQQEIGFDRNTDDWKKRLLEQLGISKFILGTENGLLLARMILSFSVKQKQWEVKKYFLSKHFNGLFDFTDHHLCHAASAYYTQPEDEGICITLDASGEGYCSRIYQCKKNSMELLHSICCYHSPAYYYAYITKLLGFRPLHHEGKITGLAAFGNGKEVASVLSRYIAFHPEKFSFVNKGGYHFSAMKRLAKLLSGFSGKDIAAGIQEHTEKMVSAYVQHTIRKFCNGKPVHIFLAGGLFANVKVNHQVLELPQVKSVYIFPNMGDGGLNTGAALAAGFRLGLLHEKIIPENLYLGKDFTDEEIECCLKKNNLPYRKSENIAGEIAGALINKKVVARFSGRMEYGPRALGNRSIIYPASDKNVNTWLNQRLKRTEFMPFAPVVRDTDYKDYFQISEEHMLPYKFMTITCNVTEKCKAEAPAIVHIDGTARPQIIFRKENPAYYDVLTEYKKKSGIGVLVNTSFNMHEEPIINSPEEAVEAFRAAGLDILAIGNFAVNRI